MEAGTVYEVVLSASSKKYIAKQPPHLRERFEEALLQVSQSPMSGPSIVRLKGRSKGYYRYEFFHYRIVYLVDSDRLYVFIEAAGPRGDIYKKR